MGPQGVPKGAPNGAKRRKRGRKLYKLTPDQPQSGQYVICGLFSLKKRDLGPKNEVLKEGQTKASLFKRYSSKNCPQNWS